MGREARTNEILRAQREADFQRLVGTPQPFRVHDEAGCPKCGAPKEAFARGWCHGPLLSDDPREPGRCKTIGQHLHVMCGVCKHGWLEETKDYVPDPEESPPGLIQTS